MYWLSHILNYFPRNSRDVTGKTYITGVNNRQDIIHPGQRQHITLVKTVLRAVSNLDCIALHRDNIQIRYYTQYNFANVAQCHHPGCAIHTPHTHVKLELPEENIKNCLTVFLRAAVCRASRFTVRHTAKFPTESTLYIHNYSLFLFLCHTYSTARSLLPKWIWSPRPLPSPRICHKFVAAAPASLRQAVGHQNKKGEKEG